MGKGAGPSALQVCQFVVVFLCLFPEGKKNIYHGDSNSSFRTGNKDVYLEFICRNNDAT